MSDKIEHLNVDSFDEKINATKGPCVVDFWAPWCGPCRTLTPILEELSGELKEGEGVVYKVNVDDNRELAARYGIRSIPTLIFFKDGEKMDQVAGVLQKDKIRERLGSS